MPLKADQRAMLQLLLERGQSYDDLASVLGVDGDEVRERARAALRELGGADPDADVALTDYLLGQADPIGRADVVRHIQSDPETAALAEKIANQLQLLAPDAELPDIPRAKGAKVAKAERRKPDAVTGDADRTRGASPYPLAGAGSTARTWWQERRAASIAILAAFVALVVVGVLAIAGVIGGGDGGSSGEDTAPLLGYPLAPLEVKDGEIKGALPVDQIGLTVLSRSQFVDLALSNNEELSPALTSALQQGQPVIDYQGTSVLRGDLADASSDKKALALDLEPAEGSTASGGLVVRAEDEQPVIDLSLKGLDPAPEGQTYVLWAILPEGTELPPASETPPSQGGALPGQGGGTGGGGGAGGGGGGGGGG